jgi:hypothetical protein
MINSKLELLTEINQLPKSETVHLALSLLNQPDIRLIDGVPTCETVQNLSQTLSARLANANRLQFEIQGLSKLLETLSVLDTNERIIGYGLISKEFAGNLYFLEKKEFIGVVFVERE